MSANTRCPRISGIVLVLLLPAALITARPANGISQQLILSAEVGKTTFFEGEPVYLLVRLQNLGTDTAWTASFGLLSPAGALSGSRGHGQTAAGPKPGFDHFVRASRPGGPGPPRGAGYKAALIDWVERRLSEQPEDPFLPFLLSDGLYGVGQILWRHIQAGEVQRFDPDTSEVVSQLRLAVIESQKLSIAGAHLVQALSARHRDQLAILGEHWGATPAGEMARSHVARNHSGQQPKTQPPR